MELYYENLISEDTSLERLVEDLMRVVQGADDFIRVAGVDLDPERREEINGHLARLKESCQRLKERAVASAVAADKLVRRYPYAALGIALTIGTMSGIAIARRRE